MISGMTYLEAVHSAQTILEEHQVPDADTDALLLLQFVCGMTHAGYYAHRQENMPEDAHSRYMDLIQMRASRVPLQHLTKEQCFMGLTMEVRPDVLIPRQDTEILVQEALSHVRKGDAVLDLCTGSGCILVSILKLGKHLTGCGSDLSPGALELAARNAQRCGVEADFLRSDLFEDIDGCFDMIVSNPPYIRSEDLKDLMEEVRDHEPVLALDGGEDGLCCYRRIVPESLAHLEPGGWLIVEIGYDQGSAVRSMFEAQGYEEIKVVKDLGGNDRVVLGRKKIV